MERALDPREVAIDKRFKGIKYSVLVLSGKGGVGKSVISSIISLLLAKEKFKVGLLDLDLHGPVIPRIFSLEKMEPEESKHGLVPPEACGVRIMSLAFFTEDKPLPLRGSSKTEAIKEVLAITNWGNLDFLIVDMPPGTGDEVLTAVKYVKSKKGALVVSTPSALTVSVTLRTLNLLKDLKVPIIALVNNMAYLRIGEEVVKVFGNADLVSLTRKFDIGEYVELPIEPRVNSLIESGKVAELTYTEVALKLSSLIEKLKMRALA